MAHQGSKKGTALAFASVYNATFEQKSKHQIDQVRRKLERHFDHITTTKPSPYSASARASPKTEKPTTEPVHLRAELMTKPMPSPCTKAASRRSALTTHHPRRSDERDNHRQMNGIEAGHARTDLEKVHHGQGGAGTNSSTMDLDTENAGTRGSAPRATQHPSDNAKSTSLDDAPPPASASTSLATFSQNSLPSNSSNTQTTPPARLSDLSPDDVKTEPGVSQGAAVSREMAYAPSRPHSTQDLFSLYSLTPLAQGVARRDLTTGAKINAMRKTYAGQIKAFQLAGKNKAVAHGEGGVGMAFAELGAWPEHEWANQKVSGKDLSKGLSGATRAKLEKAMKLEPGPVPKDDEWQSALGLDVNKGGKHSSASALGDGKVKILGSAAGGTKVHSSGRTNGISNGGAVRISAAEQDNRPKRAGKKRRYNDDSFEGYGEGFDDDRDEVDTGYSSGGDGNRRGSISKKRRKDYAALNAPIGSGVGGYTAGLMGVGRGIGAYGGR